MRSAWRWHCKPHFARHKDGWGMFEGGEITAWYVDIRTAARVAAILRALK